MERMEKQLTAVEWLEKEMQKTYIFNQDDFDMFKQAKAMEKEQIERAYKMGRHNHNVVMSDKFYAEQYYNETFKSE